MMWVLTCQCCRDLHHECYGLADRSAVSAIANKKTCQDVVVEGELLQLALVLSSTDMMVVVSALVALWSASSTVAPVKPQLRQSGLPRRGRPFLILRCDHRPAR